MKNQIIAKWNENKGGPRIGGHHLKIEPQEYRCDVMGGEEIWGSNLLKEKAENKLRVFQLMEEKAEKKLREYQMIETKEYLGLL